MKHLVFIIAMAVLFVGNAFAADYYCGGTAADTTGQGYALWHPKVKTVVDAWSSSDGMIFIADSHDTLSAALGWNEINNTITGNGFHSYFVGTDYVTLTTSTGMVWTDWNLHAQVNFVNGCTGTFTGGSITCPSGVTPYQTNAAISMRLGPNGTEIAFDGCDILTDDQDLLNKMVIGGAYAHAITFSDMTMQLGITNFSTEGAATATIDFDNIVYDGTLGHLILADFQRITFTNSTFDCDSLDGFWVTQTDSVVFTGNTFNSWGQEGSGHNAAFYGGMPTASADLTARYYDVSDNDFLQTSTAFESRCIEIVDTLDASAYSLKNNRFGTSTVERDSMVSAIYVLHGDPDVYVDNCTVYSGNVKFALSDTTAVQGTHTFENLKIDHSGNTSFPESVALQIITTNQTISNVDLTTNLSHAFFFGSDDLGAAIPGVLSTSRAGSYNIADNWTVNLLPSINPDGYVGGVIKAVDVTIRNSAFTRTGGPTAKFGFITVTGDSSLITNCTLASNSFTGTTGGIVGTGTFASHQAAENVIQNCIVTGGTYYMLNSLSGDGSGFTEKNNDFSGLTYTTFDEDAGITLSSTSFDGDTGLTAGNISDRNKFGGASATGIVGLQGWFYPIGIQTGRDAIDAAATDLPHIHGEDGYFATPMSTLEFIRLINTGEIGAELTMLSGMWNQMNLDIWLTSYASGAADTLKVVRAIK